MKSFFITSFFLTLSILSSACSRPPTLKAVQATPTFVETTISTTNSGTVDAQQQSVLGFGVSGRVQKISVQDGDHVKKNQILAELENTDLRTIFQDSAKELERSEQLFKSGLYSQAALDESKKNYQIARANLDKTIIRAPFDGMITELNLEKGELSQPNTTKPPIRIIDLKPRVVKGNIDEVDLSRVREGSAARIKIPAIGPKPFHAVVTRVIPYVNTTREQDRTSEIELKLDAGNQLIPVGASADIEVIVESKPNTLALPTRVILGRSNQRYVFRYDHGKLHKTPIEIGIGNYDRSEIVKGVSAGDVIVFPPDTVELQDDLRVKTEITQWP